MEHGGSPVGFRVIYNHLLLGKQTVAGNPIWPKHAQPNPTQGQKQGYWRSLLTRLCQWIDALEGFWGVLCSFDSFVCTVGNR